jgi:chromosome partitioning protein
LEDIRKNCVQIRGEDLPELRAVSFLNRADPVGSDNEDSREILSAVAGIEFAGLTIVNRKAFGKAVALGLSVMELNKPDEKATREILALYEYLFSTKLG